MCERNECHTIRAVSELPYAFARAPPLPIATIEFMNGKIFLLRICIRFVAHIVADPMTDFITFVEPFHQMHSELNGARVFQSQLQLCNFEVQTKDTARIIHFRLERRMPHGPHGMSN